MPGSSGLHLAAFEAEPVEHCDGEASHGAPPKTDSCPHEEAPQGVIEAKVAPTDRGDDDDGVLSEVWPDDLPGDLSALAALVDGSGVAQASTEAPAESSAEAAGDDDFIEAWEVSFARVVARAAPKLDAPVVAIFSQTELIFEEAGCPDPRWVKLFGREAYILKDGRLRDPSWGDLLTKLALPAVPEAARHQVLRAMRAAWVEAQASTDFLKPPEIRRLRAAAQDALAAASAGAAAFDLAAFVEKFAAEVQKLNADVSGHSGHRRSSSGGGGGDGMHWKSVLPSLPRDAGNSAMITPGWSRAAIESMRHRGLPSKADVADILRQASRRLQMESSLVKLTVSEQQTLHVVGDLHGQYRDLVHILEMCGEPSSTNMYLFNGDLVDRGAFSVEVAVAVLAMKLAHGDYVHINRGNHESVRMNMLFGFQAEATLKYDDQVFHLFSDAFRAMPVATVVNDSVFVVHGGLSRELTDLSTVECLDRGREPEHPEGSAAAPSRAAEEGPVEPPLAEPPAGSLLVDLLWSDPMEQEGFADSLRGSGVRFGPDVTERFCSTNGLACVIRSHEMKREGFEWSHRDRCLTVFSASNYCDMWGNSGAVCDITARPEGGAAAPSPERLLGAAPPRKLSVSDLRVRNFPPTSAHVERVGTTARFGFFC